MAEPGQRSSWVVWVAVVGIVVVGAAVVFSVAGDGEGGEAMRGWITTVQLAFFGLSLLAVLANWLIARRKRSGR